LRSIGCANGFKPHHCAAWGEIRRGTFVLSVQGQRGDVSGRYAFADVDARRGAAAVAWCRPVRRRESAGQEDAARRRIAALGRMTIQRMDHVGVVVDDLEGAIAFFVEGIIVALAEELS
jgi:hypothetical protein